MGETPRNFAYASGTYGREDAFRGICAELLDKARVQKPDPIFDAVLIDEAQDLPPEFFQLVYALTRPPKRIVWAFDELQKLSEAVMPDTRELFGVGPNGENRVSVANTDGEPRRDIVLPRCYRNTPWALATAHALGLGVNRDGGLVQHPDDPKLWEDIGYETVSGELRAGQSVVLKRAERSYPAYFPELIAPEDAVRWESFEDEAAQDVWIAREIQKNLTVDELRCEDVLVVLPSARIARGRARDIGQQLKRLGIQSHLVGVDSSGDALTKTGSVALAHIFRAKGNEAPMVYVVDAQRAQSQYEQITRRNTLFTSITRSRAWVRICGWGPGMAEIQREIEATAAANFALAFTVPTAETLRNLRHIHRDRPKEEQQQIKQLTDGFASFLKAITDGTMEVADIPTEVVSQLPADLLKVLDDLTPGGRFDQP